MNDTNSRLWRVERDEKWVTDHEGDPYFYEGREIDEPDRPTTV